jgi:hypothetical protein
MRLIRGVVTVSALTASAVTAPAQLPLAPKATTGQTVTPVFEGWYRNPDGTFSLSFGYYNRNTDEALEIAIGADNVITPGPANQGQPTRFEPRRHWGVFAVKVPAGFDTRAKVTWTLKVRGETFAIPGSLHPDWEIDALAGEAGSGNTPPVITFTSGSVVAQGPAGAMAEPISTRTGQPVSIALTASDDGRSSGSVASAGRGNVPVTLTWFKHQGPGNVTFSPAAPKPGADGLATTQAVFDRPGDYILRVRANDASGVAGAGHAQCCWTNGFVRVVVSP